MARGLQGDVGLGGMLNPAAGLGAPLERLLLSALSLLESHVTMHRHASYRHRFPLILLPSYPRHCAPPPPPTPQHPPFRQQHAPHALPLDSIALTK